jgi:hypothetical protein
VPRQFAELVAPNLGLQIYESPVPLPASDINMFWHARHDGDAGHQWLRQQIGKVRDEFQHKIRYRTDPALRRPAA